MPHLSHTAAAFAACLVASGFADATQRTFVASFGNDANIASNCTFLNPCRSFTGAQTVTDDGGEIVALDAAGYGVVTITKSIGITANPGFYAGITAATGTAVTIATAGVKVVLRGLNINGTGGANGIVMTDGAALSIENCVISNFTASGVFVNVAGASARISGSLFRGNFDAVWLANGNLDVTNTKAYGFERTGFLIFPQAGTSIGTMAVTDSVASEGVVGLAVVAAPPSIARMTATRVTATMNSTNGLRADGLGAGSPVLSVSSSVVTGNAVGWFQSGTAVLESHNNNVLRNNDTASSGTTSFFGGS